ncbi:trypsin-like peptidase domain-containing protein [Streptomyces sp. M2CJ-2]|uniref:S1C family serine protease n=1 Tax=Streptomyces sp. M2CJ-2 TaxID=2803948 RepID=UPI00192972EB|nr:trypsin-like peptidase domain-containing protein [Streptomyces sp. M2CJ-2]MBL3667140.1 trypsin-like peptidase domain-containing protein [Streptomyces sp. M2CJ-2]
MNEGKLTKAGPTGEQEGPAESGAAGATPPEAANRYAGPGGERARDADGDFELARPATPADTPGGDYELHRPLSAEATEVTEAGEAAAAGRLAGAVEPAGAGYGVGQTERPRPLHDPDPYSTPPYGEPGPWAPAPPVQHPAATPAQGTAAPPPVRQPASDMPAPGAPAPAAAAPVAPTVLEPGAPDASHTAPAPPAASDTDATAAADPWQRYDPWAAPAAGASAPLQQTGVAEPTKDQRRKRARRKLIGLMLVVALAVGGVGGIVGAHLERNGGVGAVELPQAGEEPAGREPGSIAGIAAQALPSVVTLHVSGAASAGTGTGFVLDDRGHILTNDHVVQPAGSDGEITVTFHSGDTAKATLVGRDSGYDLAVVKVKGVSGLDPLPLGNSDNVRVGDPVIAIGAPFDLAGTVTAGIISARERPITAGGGRGDGSDVSYVDALQTDAPINPGNSGGPLLDAQARVIGINSAIRSAGSGGDEGESGQAGSIGLGFAIPVNQGKRVAEELINTGKATHPVIGITLDMDYAGDGARVGTRGSDGGPPVSTGGPGAKAGIKAGDVITKVDGRRVHSGEELIVKTRAHRPGDRLELTLERDGEEREVSLVLGSSDGD